MTPAVSYMRCSGRGQVGGDTWERQHETIVKFANSHDYEIHHEYREEAVPGKTDEEGRPAFQEMIAALLENGCRMVIVESLDRLAREYRIQEQLITYIASKGISLISANTGENITDAMMGDPMRRAMVQMQGVFAELDKNMTVAKLRKARERGRAAGRKVEGAKAYGHNDQEKHALRCMRALRLAGQTYQQIAVQLNSQQIPTRFGGKWGTATVAKILTRDRMTSEIAYPKSDSCATTTQGDNVNP